MRRALLEHVYRLPASGTMVMWDFYALESLWFALGSGRSTYGYVPDKISTDRRESHINDAFESCTFQLAERIVATVKDLVYGEMENCCDEYLIPPAALACWLENEAPANIMTAFKACQPRHGVSDDSPFILPPPNAFWSRIGWPGAVTMFRASFWAEHADSYGGARWADITDRVMTLLRLVKHGSPAKDLAVKIDGIYDLEHNTGMLFDKKGCSLKVSKQDLDSRFSVRTIGEFKPHVSRAVRELLISAEGIMAGGADESSSLAIRKLSDSLLG